MSQRVSYHYDADRDDYEIRLERVNSPIPHKVLCRASSLGLAQHKARKRAEELRVPWLVVQGDEVAPAPVEPVVDEPEAAPTPDYPKSARDLVELIESGQLAYVELAALLTAEQDGKARKTVVAALEAAISE